MAPLRAIEEVFFLALFGFGGGGVVVWVGDFGVFAVAAGAEYVPIPDEGGEGGGEEDVARGLGLAW